jgi:hypothetical protein
LKKDNQILKQMKKVMYGICMLGLLAMFSTSCKKNNDQQQGSTFTVATTPFEEDDMKAYYHPSNNKFVLETGDQIKVYNLNDADPSKSVFSEFTVTGQGGSQNNQTIQGQAVGEMMSGYYAFYPYDMAEGTLAFLREGNKDIFNLPVEQTAFIMKDGVSYTLGGSAVPMCAKSTDGLHFQFYNIYGLCCIRLFGDPDMVVESIELTDNHYNLGGKVQFKVNGINQDTITNLMGLFTANNPSFEAEYLQYLNDIEYYVSETNGKTMLYHAANLNNAGGVALNSTNPANFYIGLRPMALSEGFTYKINFVDGRTATVYKYEEANRAYGMVPNRIKAFRLNISLIDPDDLPEGTVVWTGLD